MGKDIFTKEWITENSIIICSRYEDGMLTLRGLHYQLVGLGMTNDLNHYKRVVNSMIDARWNEKINFEQFSDLDRAMVGKTESESTDVNDSIETAKTEIINWMEYYSKNRWENQNYHPEVLIEKKALQGVFQSVCREYNVGLGACKGYPSLTFLHDLSERFWNTNDKIPVIIYFGDYDPSGEDIPRSIEENLRRFGHDRFEIKRIALMESQVVEWNLPAAPTKNTDTRSAKWNGIGQVELDAVKPEQLQKLCTDAISSFFNDDLYKDLILTQRSEKEIYKSALKTFIKDL